MAEQTCDRFPPELIDGPVGYCADCGEEIFRGDTCYTLDDGTVCRECFLRMNVDSLLDRITRKIDGEIEASAKKDMFCHGYDEID